VGIVLGGVLTSWLSWRWGLFINVPIGITAIALAPAYLPETPRDTKSFDVAGAAAGSLGMFALVFGFVRAGTAGWSDWGAIISFVVGVALLGGLILVEMRARHPMMPLRLFASVERTGALIGRLFLVGSMFSSLFFLTQYFQGVRGFSAVEAGFAFLPMTGLMFAMSRVVPRLAPVLGTARLLFGGLVIDLIGLGWLSRVSVGTNYFPGIAVPLLFLGVGAGIAFITLTGRGIAGVPDGDAGAASGLVNVFHQVGGCLGIAVMTTIFVSATAAGARRHTGHSPASPPGGTCFGRPPRHGRGHGRIVLAPDTGPPNAGNGHHIEGNRLLPVASHSGCMSTIATGETAPGDEPWLRTCSSRNCRPMTDSIPSGGFFPPPILFPDWIHGSPLGRRRRRNCPNCWYPIAFAVGWPISRGCRSRE
jgi:hypothetical protein